jgi:hypothetical protein
VAYIQATAITTRLREVLEQSLGALRAVPASRFDGDIPEGLSEDEQMRRGLTAPRVRVHWRTGGRSAYSPPINGNMIIYDMTAVVTVIRTITTLEQLDESSSDVLMSAAMTDMDVIRQALEYPDNLKQTAAGAATDIVSGMLSWTGWDLGEPMRDIDRGAQILKSTHTFVGRVISRPATA